MQLKFFSISLIGFLLAAQAFGQRVYKPHSVLATGNWYRLVVKDAGVYKIDLAFLNALGVNSSNISSTAIRLYGNGGGMLPEANAIPRPDDLEENSIQVVDGGDGVLNGADYILFYASGPDQWVKDSAGQSFHHQKNIYADRAYYYLSIGGTGKRIAEVQGNLAAPISVSSFDDHYFHELDTVIFLNSGKEWFGEEFTDAPGKTLSRSFTQNIPGLIFSEPLQLRSDVVGRSVGNASQFVVQANGSNIQQLSITPVSGGNNDPFGTKASQLSNFSATQNDVILKYSFVAGSFNAQGWLNWFELFARRRLSLTSTSQLLFRDWRSVGNSTAEFLIGNASAETQVWELTDPLHPIKINGALQGNTFRFANDCSRLREYIAFNASGFLQPEVIGKINNQDLHNTTAAPYLIIAHPSLLSQAQRLAKFHLDKNKLSSVVVTTDQVFHEFGSGTPDPTAIRDFVKMYSDKYAGTPDSLRYLLLFGKSSFDYKNRVTNNSNLVPGYETVNSLDPLSTYTSDDFFGFLQDNEDINSGLMINTLDVGIGRIPAKNIEEAANYIDKIEAYTAKESFGPWRNQLTFIADDEDFNLHLQDAEVITQTAANTNKELNRQKIYLDAYRQEKGAGGSSYPQANIAINNQVLNGTLIWNYNGHGGSRRLAEETILDHDIVNSWTNPFKLPLFVTATCDFAPYDNPLQQSLGENLLLRPKTGGIALMTTTRLVFAFSNRLMNDNYMRFALKKIQGKGFPSLGEAVMAAKNYTYATSGDVTNNRKFTLLGDPALTLAFPRMNIQLESINGKPGSNADTLKATDKVMMEGSVTDENGSRLTDFTGTVYPMLLDKVQSVTTLGNDPGSQPVAFQVQSSVLYKGKASVVNGKFSFAFKMPKDINYSFGNGRLSLYANNDVQDANGSFTDFIVGGTGNQINNDKEGPQIKAFLNDEKFVNGGISNTNPILIVKLADTSGINTSGTGIGHDLVATLDNDNRQYFVLNNFYEADLDSYQKGVARFQLPPLADGVHSIKIKAWDVLNNSNETTLDFIVAKDEELQISHVLNYPNPFSSHTNFWFEHNKPGQNLQVRIHIFSAAGKLIKTIKQTINTSGNRSGELEWDGRDTFGDKAGRGVYIYKLQVTCETKTKEVIEKLFIF